MFQRLVVIFSFAAIFLLQSCATVKKEEVEIIEQKPQVSKVLEKPAARVLKRKVAIARFTNETIYGKGFFVDENKDQIGKQAMDILSAKLAATGKFILLERADIEKINKELKIGNLASLNIPADYLILGSVSEFGRKTTSDVGLFSRVKKQEAYAKVNVRLVDVQTGQIIYSEEGDGQAFSEAGTVMGIGATAGYDSSLNDKAISAAISKLANNIAEKLLDKPWKAYILSQEGSNYVISGGKAQGIKEGDVFTVYKKGNKVKNPQTGMFIELPGQPIGKLKVLSTVGDDPNNEISICTLSEGNIAAYNFADLYILEK
ncbi:CsgG/HfaB family protein [Dissulfurispira sp.]|uniref:CsgG/HfaB family protein n=1 Tax=Dissulfurispira sp. TaxID=2817609 RepID=UPI002FD952AE